MEEINKNVKKIFNNELIRLKNYIIYDGKF